MNNPPTFHRSHARWFLIALALAIILCGLPVAVWVGSQKGNDAPTNRSVDGVSPRGPEAGGMRKTRSSVRTEPGPKATHGPHQLKVFYLPPLDFSGTTLKEALEQVRAAYIETCRESGEEPLELVFALPAGVNPVLGVKTRYRTLESTVHLLAAASKLPVKRHGREFRFTTPPQGNGRLVKREFDLPPGINAADYLTQIGLVLDPDTRLVSTSGRLVVETASAADLAACGSVALSLAMDPPISQKLTAKLVQLSAGTDWQYGDHSSMTDIEVQTAMRDLAKRKGVELMTLPSVLAKPEQDAKIEIIRELITKSEDPAGGFETHPVGVVLDSNLYPFGLGHQVKSDLSITSGRVDPATGRAVIEQQAGIACESFSTDAGTIVSVQTHPDGSRTVLMISPLLIDATGKPARETEGER